MCYGYYRGIKEFFFNHSYPCLRRCTCLGDKGYFDVPTHWSALMCNLASVNTCQIFWIMNVDAKTDRVRCCYE